MFLSLPLKIIVVLQNDTSCNSGNPFVHEVTSSACNSSRAKLTEDGQNEATNRIAFRCGGETDRRWKLQIAKCGGVTREWHVVLRNPNATKP